MIRNAIKEILIGCVLIAMFTLLMRTCVFMAYEHVDKTAEAFIIKGE